MSKPSLVGVVWWPHSGGRWFCRSILNQHSKIQGAMFVQPWLFYTTDMTMELDITAQVHKARSLPELEKHLKALKTSIDDGRVEGLRKYFQYIQDHYLTSKDPETHLVGEMCLGSPIPRSLDLEALYRGFPEIKLIHLVRNPVDSFNSFTVRHEMDSDPVKIAGSWLTLNAQIRTFFEARPEFKDRCLIVKYEDLLEKPEEILPEVCAFMGLDYEPEMLASVERRWGRNTKSACPEDAQKLIEFVAGPELKSYGYLVNEERILD
ncbi:MAG: sulfotransferase [Bacteroidetes bacterium]|nr:sulfotransferase [Bacteroidota bacterium]